MPLTCLGGRSVNIEESADGSDGVYVFSEKLGGPYSDDWYLYGNIDELKSLVLSRIGKSGNFKVRIAINCSDASVIPKGKGLLWDDIKIEPSTVNEYLSKELFDAVLEKACKQTKNAEKSLDSQKKTNLRK